MAYPILTTTMIIAAVQTGQIIPADTTPTARQTIGRAIGAILQADATGVRDLLAHIPANELNEKDVRFRTCAMARLTGSEAGDAAGSQPYRDSAFAERFLAAYRSYWRESVANPESRAKAERQLAVRLTELLGRPRLTDMDAVEPVLAAALAKHGLHSLEGRTGKLRELMLWSRQAERTETVRLPEGLNATRVVYLDGFLSQGWGSDLTCNRSGSGGWTKSDGLYVVVPAYKSLTDENFRVNFLAHESQHFADRRRFPNLDSWQLEYRAKLVELAYAVETSNKVLQRFIDSQGDDPADAHSFANKKVLNVLEAKLGLSSASNFFDVPISARQQAALAELTADSLRLENKKEVMPPSRESRSYLFPSSK